jgi:threonylcarbamoyladenosine tRNA methylthiotransferase MtaB
MPLQSGSNAILKQMKRRYQRELYAERVSAIKKLMPECCIGVDVIVGFPGETEEHFLETYNFINSLDVSYLHVFTYSERDNTEAIIMEGVVPIAERKRRNKMLRILSAKKLRAFYETQRAKELTVIFEHENKDGFMFGFTQNYVKVKYPYNADLCNKPLDIIVGDFDEDGNMTCVVKEQLLA